MGCSKLELNIQGINQLCSEEDIYVESGELVGTDLILTLTDASEVVIDMSALAEDVHVSNFELLGTTLRITLNDTSTFDVELNTLDDLHVTGFALNGTTLTITRSDAVDFDVDIGGVFTDTDTLYTLVPDGSNPNRFCLYTWDGIAPDQEVACITIPDAVVDCDSLLPEDCEECYDEDSNVLAKSSVGGCLICMPAIKGNLDAAPDPALDVFVDCDGTVTVEDTVTNANIMFSEDHTTAGFSPLDLQLASIGITNTDASPDVPFTTDSYAMTPADIIALETDWVGGAPSVNPNWTHAYVRVLAAYATNFTTIQTGLSVTARVQFGIEVVGLPESNAAILAGTREQAYLWVPLNSSGELAFDLVYEFPPAPAGLTHTIVLSAGVLGFGTFNTYHADNT